MSENEIIKKENLQITNHDFLIYRDANNDVKISVLLINNDIWLTHFRIWATKILKEYNKFRIKQDKLYESDFYNFIKKIEDK